MWLLFAFLSATLLGFYDVSKKQALKHHDVIPVLFLNTLFCSLIFLPVVFTTPAGGWEVQKYILLKACIVLSSWLLGYFGMKHLPLTIVGPINATRPVMVLLGAILVFGERLNLYQWAGVLLAITSFFLLSRTGRKEDINFRHNKWIFCIVGAAVMGAVSGLYDKYLIALPSAGGLGLNRMVVQSYYNIYQCMMMGVIALAVREKHQPHKRKSWRSLMTIFLISVFLSAADFAYFHALSLPCAMISVVSMVRRSSVLVSFSIGAFLFHEKNLRSKAIDLALVLLSMVLLYLGT